MPSTSLTRPKSPSEAVLTKDDEFTTISKQLRGVQSSACVKNILASRDLPLQDALEDNLKANMADMDPRPQGLRSRH